MPGTLCVRPNPMGKTVKSLILVLISLSLINYNGMLKPNFGVQPGLWCRLRTSTIFEGQIWRR
jgi:hypothetical protein